MWRGCIISKSKKKVICEVKHYNKQWCMELLCEEHSQVKGDKYCILGKNLLEYEFAKYKGLFEVYTRPKVEVPVIRGRKKRALGGSDPSQNVEEHE